jgi:hypothetical protein
MKYRIITIFVLAGLCYSKAPCCASLEAVGSAQFFNAVYAHYEDQYLHQAFESISGPGSTLEQTRNVRSVLPEVIKKYNITSILDAPCGDFNWMRYVALGDCVYYGIDIVDPLIKKLQNLYTTEQRHFMVKNIIVDQLPGVDLIVCRDCLVHFSYDAIYATLLNLKKSGARYLLTTTFTYPWRENQNISTGGWCALNLQKAPFKFPAPLFIINEGCTEQGSIYADKSLALWSLDDIVSD